MSLSNPATRKTVGHHFSDLLICRQKAWLHYHGNPSQKMPPPAYLRALQQDGLAHESNIYNQFFPNAIQISNHKATRQQETESAMRQGASVILQAYVATQEGVGIIDVLEKAGTEADSRTGFCYIVGEIKRSTTLKTAHVMQACWYTELLNEIYHQHAHQAFFILGDGQRQFVDLDTITEDYKAVKADLFTLRDSEEGLGPHLIAACSSCDWRGVCMPQLSSERHLSLVPGLNPHQVQALYSQGIHAWEDLSRVSDQELEDIGLYDYEIERLRVAIDHLVRGLAPMRHILRPEIFEDGIVVALEFPELALRRRLDEPLRPSAIYYESAGGTQSIPVTYDQDGAPQADLIPLLPFRKLLFFGQTDRNPFQHLFRHLQPSQRLEMVDIVEFIETYVHSTYLGLDLDSLVSHITGKKSRIRSRDRVAGIRLVVNWIRESL